MGDSITVTRALVMLKTLDKRISKLTQELIPLDILVDKKLLISKQTKEEFSLRIKSEYQKLIDLITQRNTIKSGVVTSNANTKIKIANVELTVAEAIERKSSIVFEKDVIRQLKMYVKDYSHKLDQLEDQVTNRLDRLLESTFSKDSTKVKTEEYDAVAKPFMDRNQPTLVDPLEIRNIIEKLTNTVDVFEEEVDIALSESNATTYIEI